MKTKDGFPVMVTTVPLGVKCLNQKDDPPIFGKPVAGCPYYVRPSAYGLVRRLSGELAVAQTRKGIHLPGGGLERDEDAGRAVEREAMEECGLVVRVQAEVGTAIEIAYSAEENSCFEKRCTFFEAELVGANSSQQTEHELVWMDMNQACTELTHESYRWAAQRLREKTRAPQGCG